MGLIWARNDVEITAQAATPEWYAMGGHCIVVLDIKIQGEFPFLAPSFPRNEKGAGEVRIKLEQEWPQKQITWVYKTQFIHSILISCSLIGPLVNTQSVLKIYNALHVLLLPDRACDRHIEWSIFSLGKVVLIFFMLSGILKPFYFNFSQTWALSNWFWLCCCFACL